MKVHSEAALFAKTQHALVAKRHAPLSTDRVDAASSISRGHLQLAGDRLLGRGIVATWDDRFLIELMDRGLVTEEQVNEAACSQAIPRTDVKECELHSRGADLLRAMRVEVFIDLPQYRAAIAVADYVAPRMPQPKPVDR